MKKEFPSYQSTGTAFIIDRLSSKEKKILKDFIEYCGITAGEKKLRVIKATLLQVRDITGKPYDKIELEDVRGFLALLKQAKLSEWTKNDIRKYLKKFLKWYYKDIELIEDIKQTPLKKAFNHKRVNESTLVKKDELNKLLRTAQTLKWKAILMLLFETGCRPQELRLLKWKHIRFTDDGADVTFFSGKTEEARTIPIRDCVVHLRRWFNEYSFPDVNDEDFVFPSIKRENMMSDNALPKQMKTLCKQAKIRDIYPYMFRHTRLTQMYKDLPEQIVKKYAGHSAGSKMPVIYSHISSKDVKEIILKKIYNVKEISPQLKHKLEKELDKLKEELKNKDMKLKQEMEEAFKKQKQEFLKVLLPHLLKNKNIKDIKNEKEFIEIVNP